VLSTVYSESDTVSRSSRIRSMADQAQLKINKRPKDDQSDDEKEDSSTLELGYWKIQGLAAPARMMLVFAGVEFNNKMYEVKATSDNGWDLSDWFNVKFNIDVPFPNLPYIIDHQTGLKFSGSKTVWRYVARQYKVGVQEDPYLSIADMMVEQIGQVMGVESPLSRSGPYVIMSYGPFDGKAYTKERFEEAKATYIKELPELLKGIEEFMGNKKFVTGPKISYADFALYYLCVTHSTLDDTFLTRFPNLAAFYKRFGALEGIKRWHKTSMSKLPFNNKMAMFK